VRHLLEGVQGQGLALPVGQLADAGVRQPPGACPAQKMPGFLLADAGRALYNDSCSSLIVYKS